MKPASILCPYCRDRFDPYERLVTCSHCSTLYHRSCWQENAQCAVFGCSGKPATGLRKYLVLLPALILTVAGLHPTIAVLLSFLLLPAYFAWAIETLYFTTSVVQALCRRNREYHYGSALVYFSANMVSILIFSLGWAYSHL